MDKSFYNTKDAKNAFKCIFVFVLNDKILQLISELFIQITNYLNAFVFVLLNCVKTGGSRERVSHLSCLDQ